MLFALAMASTVRVGFRGLRRSVADLTGIPADGAEIPDESRFSRGGTAGPKLVGAAPQLSAEPRLRAGICGLPLSSNELALCPDFGRCFGGSAGMM